MLKYRHKNPVSFTIVVYGILSSSSLIAFVWGELPPAPVAIEDRAGIAENNHGKVWFSFWPECPNVGI